MFSGGREKVHWEGMGQYNLLIWTHVKFWAYCFSFITSLRCLGKIDGLSNWNVLKFVFMQSKNVIIWYVTAG